MNLDKIIRVINYNNGIIIDGENFISVKRIIKNEFLSKNYNLTKIIVSKREKQLFLMNTIPNSLNNNIIHFQAIPEYNKELDDAFILYLGFYLPNYCIYSNDNFKNYSRISQKDNGLIKYQNNLFDFNSNSLTNQHYKFSRNKTFNFHLK